MSYPYSEPPGTPTGSQVPTNSLAIISIITGIAGLLGFFACCCSPAITGGWFLLLGIPAAITGWMARNQIMQSYGQQEGESLALTGLIMGIVEIVVALFFICLTIFSMMGMIALPAFEEIMQSSSF